MGLPPAGSPQDPLAPGFDPLAGLDPRPQHLALIDYTDAGDLPAGQPETFWYLHDRLGSVVAIADAAGQVVERYAYDPFGRTYRLDPDTAQPLLDAAGQPVLTSSLANPHRWTGQRQDPATGLYLFPFRTFSPRLGQWLQRDPLLYVDSLNPYAYARHNPLRWTDPLGLDVWVETVIVPGPGRGWVPGHQRLCVGDPKGDYVAFSFKPLFDGSGQGLAYIDTNRRGRIDPKRYRKTTRQEDRHLIKKLLTHVGDQYPYDACGFNCRAWSGHMWEVLTSGVGAPARPPVGFGGQKPLGPCADKAKAPSYRGRACVPLY